MTQRVAILGVGLIGGSIGGALRRSGMMVSGYDVVEGRAEVARQLGLIDRASPTPAGAMAGSDAIVIAAPVRATVKLLEEVDAQAPLHAVVVDVASVKGPVVEAMAVLPGGARMIGGHPIAGREVSGPEAADPDLFQGRPFALCSSPRTDPLTRARASALVEACGAWPVHLDAAEHDAVLARTSHLPQVLSTALTGVLQPSDGLLAGPALESMLRLASSDPAMWREIATTNGPNIAAALRAFGRQLELVAGRIEEGDALAIERMFSAARLRVHEIRCTVST